MLLRSAKKSYMYGSLMHTGSGIGVILFSFIPAASTKWHPAKESASIAVQVKYVKRISVCLQ
jgi:hypothetical protein